MQTFWNKNQLPINPKTLTIALSTNTNKNKCKIRFPYETKNKIIMF